MSPQRPRRMGGQAEPPRDLTCPACGGRLARIVYGMIGPGPDDPDAVAGGCVVGPATHVCRQCGKDYTWDGQTLALVGEEWPDPRA